MVGNSSNKAIQWVVKKARKDPFFLGWAISQYQKSNKMDDQELATLLQCSEENLHRLAVCRLPDDENSAFQEHVKQIADYVSCNVDQLIRILREVSAVTTMREAPRTKGRLEYLMAARDRKPEDDDSSGKGEE